MSTQKFESRITFRILLILMGARILYSLVILTRTDSLWLESVYSFLTYSLITIIIFLNQSSLHLFNLDRVSMALFVFLGGLYSFSLSQPVGALMTIVALFNLSMLLSKELFFSRTQYSPSVIAIAVLFILIQLVYFLWTGRTFSLIPGDVKIVAALFRANFTLVIFEEIIFRGILWNYLENRGFRKYQVIFIQALFFWIVHFYYYPHLIFFWILLPFISILLGIIVHKSRSILPSFVLHYLYNFLAALFPMS